MVCFFYADKVPNTFSILKTRLSLDICSGNMIDCFSNWKSKKLKCWRKRTVFFMSCERSLRGWQVIWLLQPNIYQIWFICCAFFSQYLHHWYPALMGPLPAEGPPKQRNSYQSSLTFFPLCYLSPSTTFSVPGDPAVMTTAKISTCK